jgi:ribose 5-phosphate isomerase B
MTQITVTHERLPDAGDVDRMRAVWRDRLGVSWDSWSADATASDGGAPPRTLTRTMRVAIGSDHAGFHLKGDLCTLLDELRIEYRDFGTFDTQPVDYPDVIAPVARAVARGDYERGIVLGGSGTGEAIVANKIRGIRCVEAADPVTARLGREHNDANVLAMGARIIGTEVARSCVRAFLDGEFAAGRHVPRVAKIAHVEAEEARG